MEKLFLQIFEMSINASWLILVVILLRFLLLHTPKRMRCVLWGFVGIRLICPFSLESIFSLLPKIEKTNLATAYSQGESVWQDFAVTQNSTAIVPNDITQISTVENSANPAQIWTFIIALIWVVGMLFLGACALISYLRLKHKVQESVRVEENIWLCDHINTPFILGIFRPRIYLPSALGGEQEKYVLAHERAHLKRMDHWWKPAGYLLLLIHWFNPLVWLAYLLLCRDIELACDEKVIADYDISEKKMYSSALLKCSSRHYGIAACPVAFGEVGVKARIKAVLHYKKPTIWILLLTIICCIVVAVCFLTNPKSDKDNANLSTPIADTQITDTQTTDTQMPDTQTQESQVSYHVLENWAKAFINRDGNVIAQMASEEVKDVLKERELLYGEDGANGFGMSSPWPVDETNDFVICDINGQQAEIHYYARTSDPQVTVWKEMLLFEERDGAIQVIEEELSYLDNIASAEEFESAYFSIDDTPMDYTKNGLAEAVYRNAQLSSSERLFRLRKPDTAAIELLNLLDNPNKVSVDILSEDSERGVAEIEISFAEGNTTKKIFMVQYAKEIWLPKDYHIDTIGKLKNIDWDKIEAGNLSFLEQDDEFSDIICIGELPKQGIKLYGYNDEEISGQGVVISVNEEINFFDWIYTSSRNLYPSLYWKEDKYLQVSLKIISGTGASAEQLHVLIRYDTGKLQDNAFLLEEYASAAKDKIDFTYDAKTKKLSLMQTDTKQGLADIILSEAQEEITDLEIGLNSQFVLGETIYFRVMPGYVQNGAPMPNYTDMPYLEAPVILTEEDNKITFSLGEFQVITE